MATDVGILAVSIYFPRYAVRQADLEAADGVPGKYTSGLGQEALAFCSDREDSVSLAATAVSRLMEGYGVAPGAISRLSVGTETGVDRSKSVASHLLDLFRGGGNTRVAAVDHTHGCYGATSALLAAADWVCGPRWDGGLALVVGADVAVYPAGSPAAPTGGCGAVALLVGPSAPLVLQPHPWAASHSAHTWDFYKPHGHPCFPVVDGPASLHWFTAAAEAAAATLWAQVTAAQQQQQQQGQQRQQQEEMGAFQPDRSQQAAEAGSAAEQQQQRDGLCHGGAPGSGLLSSVDAYVSHAPFNKIVQKTFARLALQDALRQQQQQAGDVATAEGPADRLTSNSTTSAAAAGLDSKPTTAAAASTGAMACSQDRGTSSSPAAALTAATLPPDILAAAAAEGWAPDQLSATSLNTDKALQRSLVAWAAPAYAAMAAPAAALQRQLGNMYTASVWAGLGALVAAEGEGLAGRRVLLYSFGSGAVGSMLVVRGRGTEAGAGEWSLGRIQQQLDLQNALKQRLYTTPAEFHAKMEDVVAAYGAAPFQPKGSTQDLAPGTWYLEAVDEKFRRTYARVPL